MDIININIILILLILFILYIYYEYFINNRIIYNCGEYKVYKKILYSDIKPYIKTGDLLFFERNLKSIHESSFAHQQFSHIGIVVKINDILYCYESYPENIENDIFNNSHGIKLSPLYARLINYNGDIYIASLKNKLEISDEINLISQINSKKYTYTSDFKIFLSYLFNSKSTYNNERTCGEFIALILDNLSITHDIKKSKKKELTKNIVLLSNGELYSNPIHLIADNSIIRNL